LQPFECLKNSVKIEKKIKNKKKCQYLGNCWKKHKILKTAALDATYR